jgi:hypothetical protein
MRFGEIAGCVRRLSAGKRCFSFNGCGPAPRHFVFRNPAEVLRLSCQERRAKKDEGKGKR